MASTPSSLAANPLVPRSPDDPTLANTFGAWLICASVGAMLFGLTTHQTYRYFRLYPSDALTLKILAASLLVLDTLHTISNIHLCYYYLVINYLRPQALGSGVWSLRLSITETALVMLLSHAFFVKRIFLLSGRRLYPVVVIGTLMLSEMGLALAVTIMTFVLVTFAAFKKYMWLIWLMLINAVLLDLLVTTLLIYFLWKSRTGFKRTDSTLDVLMVYTINTGLSTSLLTIPAMICSITMPDNLLWSAIYVIASKMYANSLLAVLNSRRSIVDKGMEGFETGSFGLQVVNARADLRRLDWKAPVLRRGAGGGGADSGGSGDPRGSPGSSADPPKVPDKVIDVCVATETIVDISPRAPVAGRAGGRALGGHPYADADSDAASL